MRNLILKYIQDFDIQTEHFTNFQLKNNLQIFDMYPNFVNIYNSNSYKRKLFPCTFNIFK